MQAQYGDGTTINYTYDANRRPLTTNGATFSYDAAGRMTGSNGLIIARDPVGRISAVTYADGKTVTYSYNAQGLLSQVMDWTRVRSR